jgi:hypothetical protein
LVYGNSKRFSVGETCSFQLERAFGLRAKISEESPHRTSLRSASSFLGRSLSRLRVPTQRGRFRARPRTPTCLLPNQGFNFLPGQLSKRRLSTKTSICCLAGSCRKAVGEAFLVSVLLRRLLWRSPTGNSQAICGKTKRWTGLPPVLKDGVSTPKT